MSHDEAKAVAMATWNRILIKSGQLGIAREDAVAEFTETLVEAARQERERTLHAVVSQVQKATLNGRAAQAG